MPEFKIVVDGWFPHESETDRVFEIELHAFWRLSQDRIADFVKERLLRLGFDPRFEVVMVEDRRTGRLTYRQRTRPFIHHLPVDREYVWERITIPVGWRGMLETVHQCDGPELIRSLADLSAEAPRMCRVILKEGWVFHPEHKFNEYQIHTGLCSGCGKGLWTETYIPPAPQYPNADFTPMFTEMPPMDESLSMASILARYDNGPIIMDPRRFITMPGSECGDNKEWEEEPSVETTTAELRKMIGEINANRLRFDAEGKFREEGEPNPNKPPKKKWWKKK